MSVYDKGLKKPNGLKIKPSISPTNNFHQTSVCEVSNSVQSSCQQCNNMGLTSTVEACFLPVSVEKHFRKVMSSQPTALPNQASKGIRLFIYLYYIF